MRVSLGAFILAALLGCGGDDDGSSSPDASPATADAGGPDAAAVGPVSLTVILDGAPVEDAEVFFSHPDQTLAVAGQTDADGRFAADVEAGSSATVIVDGPEGIRVIHFVAIAPGDQLRAIAGERGTPVDPVGNVTVDLPPAFDGATLYTLQDGCAAFITEYGDGTPDLPIRPACAEGDIEVLAYARTNANELLAFSGGVATGIGTTVSLPAWRTDWSSIDLSTSGGAAGAPVYYMVVPRADGHDYFGPERPDVMSDDAGASAATMEFAADFFDEVHVDVQAPQSGWFARTSRRYAQPPAELAVDIAADFLPRFSALTVDADQIAWTAPAGVDAADGLHLYAEWGAAPDEISLQVVAPATARSVSFPEVPDGLPVAPFPPADTVAYYDLVEIDVVDSYASFRRSNALSELVPATGVYAMTLVESGGE